MINENLAIPVALLKAVARRMQLDVIGTRLKAERIEIGMQMTAHAVGADHHQRAHAVAGRALHLLVRYLRAFGFRLALDLIAERRLDIGPISVEG